MAILPGTPPVEVHLKRSSRARRFSLRVSRLDGKVTLSMPLRAREGEALAFLKGNEDWLRQTLQAMPASALRAVGHGAVITVEGNDLTLTPASGRGVRVEGDRLLVPGDPATAGPRVAAWLKVLARDRLASASTRYAGLVGRSYSSLAIRDTRSRWGSCTAEGELSFSWRVILAPPHVLDYLAAHEVAHLKEMNHGPKFWKLCRHLCPRTDEARAWLKRNGNALQAIDFG